MKQITYFLTLARKLRNAEHFDFYSSIIGNIDTKAELPPNLVPLLNKLRRLFQKEDAVYKRSQKHIETKSLYALHKKRKSANMWIRRMVEAATYSNDAEEHEAGLVLMDLMNKYADIHYVPMTEASALIFSMIEDLRKPRYATASVTLNLNAGIDRLAQENDAFKALYSERTYNQEEDKNEGSLHAIRLLVDAAAAEFVDSINVFYRIHKMQRPGDPEVISLLDDIITLFNAYIHQYETILAHRSAKSRPAKGEAAIVNGDAFDE
ncbi:MAG: DUF6261 family protein [Tannerellaceae bacterium]|jgi:hypothetical protein|nr:DUF6261 family protein [Tannerellaceae bacterium]